MLPDPRRESKPMRLARRDNASMRPTMKRLLGMGILAAAGYAVWRAVDARRSDSTVTWEPQPFPYPPVPRRADDAATTAPGSTPGSTTGVHDGVRAG